MMKKTKVKKVYNALNELDYSIVEYKISQNKNIQKKIIPRMKKEGLRFIALCAVSKKKLAPSYLVDEFWHNSILQTQLYTKIGKICGKFIHHNANDGSKEARTKDLSAFWNTIDEYESVFGTPDLEIWGIERREKK